jgi:CheY-like chemotaxis protein
MTNPALARRPLILVVDDVPTNIGILRAALTPTYDFLSASNGLNALELAVSHRPDLILLDIMMPEMDGYEVCMQLKRAVETLNIPVIFLTGRNSAEDEQKGLELGAVDYITKPINLRLASRAGQNTSRTGRSKGCIAA